MGKGMRAGKKPKAGGGNAQKQMRQIQAMQFQMEKIREELEEREFTAAAGGGVVSVTVNGKKEIVRLALAKDVVDPDDIEMLEDLIAAAANEALRQAEETVNEEMSRLAGGIGIPGMLT